MAPSALDKTANPGKTGQVETDKAIAELADSINALRRVAIVGLAAKDIRPASAACILKVPHGLGYPASGWVVTRVRGSDSFSLFEVPSSNPSKELWLQYTGSTAAVIDLRVF